MPPSRRSSCGHLALVSPRVSPFRSAPVAIIRLTFVSINSRPAARLAGVLLAESMRAAVAAQTPGVSAAVAAQQNPLPMAETSLAATRVVLVSEISAASEVVEGGVASASSSPPANISSVAALSNAKLKAACTGVGAAESAHEGASGAAASGRMSTPDVLDAVSWHKQLEQNKALSQRLSDMEKKLDTYEQRGRYDEEMATEDLRLAVNIASRGEHSGSKQRILKRQAMALAMQKVAGCYWQRVGGGGGGSSIYAIMSANDLLEAAASLQWRFRCVFAL